MRQGRRIFQAGKGFANRDSLDTGNGHNVAQFSYVNINTLQPAEGEQLGDLHLLERSIQFGNAKFFSVAQRSIEDAGNRHAAQIVAVIQICDQDLQRVGGLSGGLRNSA